MTSVIVLPDVETFDLDDPKHLKAGELYGALATYAKSCDNCTAKRPCKKHRELMHLDYRRRFAQLNGIVFDEPHPIVPSRSSETRPLNAFGQMVTKFANAAPLPARNQLTATKSRLALAA